MKIKLVRSPIGTTQDVRRTLRCLGLCRMHQTAEVAETPTLKGMVAKIKHLVKILP
ncbi:MAG: 50S ribosomal protein L30 [Spirochaetes bacterium]|nr:50S ribosomal protein L30 [Spirochaetota bacterium]